MVPVRYILLVLLLSTLCLGQTTSSYGTITATGHVTIGQQSTGAQLVSCSVDPPTATLPVNGQQTFTATGTFSSGPPADITNFVTWSAIGTAASNVANVYTCNSQGSITVKAQLGAVSCTALLACQALQIAPTGVITAFQNVLFSQQFVASGGTPPYTFSSSDLPGWLTLNNTGCGAQQVNCNLTGTQASLGSFSFHITVTDNLLATLTIPITVQVIAVSAEDNRYCNPNADSTKAAEGTSTLNGTFDGPAAGLQTCVYDAISATPATGVHGTSSWKLYVCDPAAPQRDNTGALITGCQTPDRITYFASVQDAMNHAQCGNWIRIFPANYDSSGHFLHQNVFNESITMPITSCGPQDPNRAVDGGQWIWVTTDAYDNSSFPQPGSRISPAWAGQTTLPGRNGYPGPSVPGIYVPLIMPTRAQCPNVFVSCPAINSDPAGDAGWRFMGLEFAMQKDVSTPSQVGTGPGYPPALLDWNCPAAGGNQNCGATGHRDIILDRILVHACQDKSDVTCTDQMPFAIRMQNGNYYAVINSYCWGIKTIGDSNTQIGETDEGHCFSGGNVNTSVNDGPTKIVNNYFEATTENFFFGGAASGPTVATTDIEMRRNHFFKPINWFVNGICPQGLSYNCIGFQGGKLFDVYLGGSGAGYDPVNAGCLVEASPTGNTATCGLTISGGAVTSAYATSQGSGYVKANIAVTACRYVSSGVCQAPPTPQLSISGGGGAALGPGTYEVALSYNFGGFETDFGIATIVAPQSCSGIPCSIVVLAPPLTGTFPSYNVYSCLIATGAKKCTPKLNQSGLTISTLINNVGSGGTHNDAKIIAEDGIYIIKNLGEFKNGGPRVLFEGNVSENVNIGQADQFGRCLEIDAKNPNLNAFNAQDVDVIVRYNLCRNAVNGPGISTSNSPGQCQTPGCQTFPLVTQRVSLHDNVYELTTTYNIKNSGFFDASGGTLKISNANPNTPPYPLALNNIKINHNTFIHTEPTNASASTLSSGVNFFQTDCNDPNHTNAVWEGMIVENNIFAGGFKNTSTPGGGCFKCSGNACGALNAMNSLWTSSLEGTQSGGHYPDNIITGVNLDSAGSCSVALTGCSFVGGLDTGGIAGTCGLSGTSSLTSIFPTSVGKKYATAPTVSFSGCTGIGDVLPTAHVFIGGANNSKPWCMDHNINVTAEFPGEVSMPIAAITAQGDTTNSCPAPSGGGNQDINTYNNVQFVNMPRDANGVEIPTGDLHLSSLSPGHGAANTDSRGDGGPFANDMGADFDLVLQFTGCSLQNGVTVCPP